MPLTAYPGILGGSGAPYMNLSRLWTTGDIWFVHNGRGSNNNDGRDSLRPRASIANAEGQTRANRGDLIVALEGHVETISAAAGLVFDTAGVALIGMGRGAARPQINFTTAVGADIDIDAASIYIDNIIFTGGIDALTGPLDVNAADFTMLNCEYRDVTGQCTDFMVADAGADRLLIDNFVYRGATAAGTNAGFALTGMESPTIKNLWMDGNFAVGGIDIRTTALTDLTVNNVIFRTRNAADIFLIDTITGSTGMIGGGWGIFIRLQDNAANITEAITGATFVLCDNIWVVNAANEKALLINWVASADL